MIIPILLDGEIVVQRGKWLNLRSQSLYEADVGFEPTVSDT